MGKCKVSASPLETARQIRAAIIGINGAKDITVNAEWLQNVGEMIDDLAADSYLLQEAMKGAEIIQSQLQAKDADAGALRKGYCAECDYDSDYCREVYPEVKCAVRDTTAGADLLAEKRAAEDVADIVPDLLDILADSFDYHPSDGEPGPVGNKIVLARQLYAKYRELKGGRKGE